MLPRCALITVLVLSALAHAENPRLAVVGVIPKDPGVTRVANTLTATMRQLANAKSSGYRVVGSPKQIDTAIKKAECSTIDTPCAATLGADLGADYVLAGELEQRGTHRVLLLVLVDVNKKQRIRSLRETSASDAKKWARTLYTKLVDADAGELVVVSNAKQGEILIDGQLVGALFEGKATISGLVNGGHRLQIRAKGYKPFETDIVVEFVTKQSVLLEPAQ